MRTCVIASRMTHTILHPQAMLGMVLTQSIQRYDLLQLPMMLMWPLLAKPHQSMTMSIISTSFETVNFFVVPSGSNKKIKWEPVFNWWDCHACPISLRMRRYFNKRSKDGNVVASQEALKLWQSDEGRVSDENNFPSQQLKI